MVVYSFDDGQRLFGYIRTARAMSLAAMTQLLADDGVRVDARFWPADVDMLLHMLWFACVTWQHTQEQCTI